MSTTEHSESLIRELIALDPSLGEREAELRVLVSELIQRRPDVTPDAAFATSLRARLLLGKRPVPSPFLRFNFWALRLAPVGALALLLLILAPQGIFNTQNSLPNSVSLSDDAMEDAQIVSSETGEAPPSIGLYGMGGGEGIDRTATMKTMTAPVAPIAPSPLIIDPQGEGVLITVSSIQAEVTGFIALSTPLPDGREEVIGVSPLILPGTTTNIPIYLRTPLRVGRPYTATLYVDNGNRLFTHTDDMPAFDQNGNMISIAVQVLPKESGM